MTSDISKESLLARIDRLREAVVNERHDELNVCVHQLLSDSSSLMAGKSPTEPIIKAIHDIVLVKQEGEENIPDIVANDADFKSLRADITNICNFMHALANGDLSQHLTVKGYLAGVLKGFQSRLKNLTWQAEMVSRGDFSQRVSFMGEFASSFNLMIEQLDKARKEQADSEEKYRMLAITDPLTGLSNRRHFFEKATHEFTRSRRYNKTMSIIMMDIDHFKNINDSYGHHMGDLVLQSMAEHLKNALRETDLPGRYGGEEFIALLPETNVGDAQTIAERIRETIENRLFEGYGHHINVTSSFGVNSFDSTFDKYESIDEVIDNADKALYRAKGAGRNQVVVFKL